MSVEFTQVTNSTTFSSKGVAGPKGPTGDIGDIPTLDIVFGADEYGYSGGRSIASQTDTLAESTGSASVTEQIMAFPYKGANGLTCMRVNDNGSGIGRLIQDPLTITPAYWDNFTTYGAWAWADVLINPLGGAFNGGFFSPFGFDASNTPFTGDYANVFSRWGINLSSTNSPTSVTYTIFRDAADGGNIVGEFELADGAQSWFRIGCYIADGVDSAAPVCKWIISHISQDASDGIDFTTLAENVPLQLDSLGAGNVDAGTAWQSGSDSGSGRVVDIYELGQIRYSSPASRTITAAEIDDNELINITIPIGPRQYAAGVEDHVPVIGKRFAIHVANVGGVVIVGRAVGSTETLFNGFPIAINNIRTPELVSAVGISDHKPYYSFADFLIGRNLEFHRAHVDALTGIDNDQDHLGIFTGNTITDNTDIKSALQEVETALEIVTASTAKGVVVSRGLTTQAIPQHDGLEATETVLDFGTDQAGVIDITGSLITITQAVQSISGNMEIHVSRTGGGQASEFVHWIELSIDGGSNWIAQPDSLRRELIPSDGNRIINTDISADRLLPAGFLLRIVATNDSSFGTLSVETPATIATSKGTIAGFATKINIHYIL